MKLAVNTRDLVLLSKGEPMISEVVMKHGGNTSSHPNSQFSSTAAFTPPHKPSHLTHNCLTQTSSPDTCLTLQRSTFTSPLHDTYTINIITHPGEAPAHAPTTDGPTSVHVPARPRCGRCHHLPAQASLHPPRQASEHCIFYFSNVFNFICEKLIMIQVDAPLVSWII